MGQPGGAERSIKAQLNRIVLIPSITFLVLFALLSTATLTQAAALRVATGDGRSGLFLYLAIAELETERLLAVEYLGAPSDGSAKALREQVAVTDDAVREVEARREGLNGRGSTRVATAATDLFTRMDRRGDVRDDVMSGELEPGEARARYTAIVDRGIRLYDAMGRELDDGAAAAASATAVDIMRAQNLLSQSGALLGGASAEGELARADQTRFSSLVTAFRGQLRAAAPALDGAARRAYADLTGRDNAAWQGTMAQGDVIAERDLAAAADADADTAVSTGSEDALAGVDDWLAWSGEVDDGLVALATAQAREVVSTTEDASTWMFTIALSGGIMALFAGTVAYGAASKSAARLTAKLARLRADTLELARQELPRIVRRLEQGEPVELDSEMRQLDYGTDEVGQVADAFNTAQRTAISAAVTQSEVRAGANRVFLGIAHRNQSLVQRQLQLLDRVERQEDDPDLLEDLFHLDHLATRGRRNAENLIILGGAQPGRRWRHPIPLVNILRGAISETEEYARVRLRVIPDLSLSGSVVADVIHLVAELVENATAFSPPHTAVHIDSEVVPKGVVVEVEDRGLGMSVDGLAQANRTLSGAPEFDVMALNQDSRLGLFVVARLAAKHEIHVELCPSPYGGTRAIVLVPAELISSGRIEPPEHAEEPADRSPIPAEAGPHPPAWVDGGDRPSLPRRRRQTNLAPQLRDEAGDAGRWPEATRSPDEVRQTMSAFQSGTRRGRDETRLESASNGAEEHHDR